MEAKALQAKAGTHCDTLGDVKAEALSDPPATTLAEAEAEKIGVRVVNLEATPLIDMLVLTC